MSDLLPGAAAQLTDAECPQQASEGRDHGFEANTTSARQLADDLKAEHRSAVIMLRLQQNPTVMVCRASHQSPQTSCLRGAAHTMGRRFFRPYTGLDPSFAPADHSHVPDLAVSARYDVFATQPTCKRSKYKHDRESIQVSRPQTPPLEVQQAQAVAYGPLRSSTSSQAVQQLLDAQDLAPDEAALHSLTGVPATSLGRPAIGQAWWLSVHQPDGCGGQRSRPDHLSLLQAALLDKGQAMQIPWWTSIFR